MHRGGLSWAELGFNCNEISRLVVPGAARNFNKESIEFTLVAGGAGSRSLPMPLLVVLAMLVLVARGGAEAAERGSQGHGRRLLGDTGTMAGGSATQVGLSANYDHSCGVSTTGQLQCWGGSGQGQLQVPSDHVWAMASVGAYHTCAVTVLREGYCWGDGGNDRTLVPSGHLWASLSAGFAHTCDVTSLNEGLCVHHTETQTQDAPCSAALTSPTFEPSCR